MAQVKIAADSGGGSVALSGPASTTSNAAVNFKLPVADGTAGQVLTTNASGQLEWKTPSIGVADQWRITATKTVSGSSDVITADWEQVDTGGQGTLGSALTQSSGIFTFPSTGIYYIQFSTNADQGGPDNQMRAKIEVTINNGTDWAIAAEGFGSLHDRPSDVYDGIQCQSLIDVTDTAQVKIRFVVYASANNTEFWGDSAKNMTYFTALRLGDT
tara:strand:+ start:69 stop:713 length:645 start_codon:yes stop_codon:yes gene_type:complete